MTYAERQRRAQVVADWRDEVGDWCPGWIRPGHPATDLTADHIRAIASGGAENGELAILCRACNSSKREGRTRVTVRRTPARASRAATWPVPTMIHSDTW